MKKMSATLTNATLALTLAMGGTALYAQDTDGPDTTVPAEPAPEPVPTEAAPPPADPAPAPVDEDGDGVDDITGEPIPEGEPQ